MFAAKCSSDELSTQDLNSKRRKVYTHIHWNNFDLLRTSLKRSVFRVPETHAIKHKKENGNENSIELMPSFR